MVSRFVKSESKEKGGEKNGRKMEKDTPLPVFLSLQKWKRGKEKASFRGVAALSYDVMWKKKRKKFFASAPGCLPKRGREKNNSVM